MKVAGAEKPTRKWVAGLEGEVVSWMRDGLISQDQAGAILSRYDGLLEKERDDAKTRLITALGIMGALLLGVGVILFFASNWQAMPKGLKVGIIFGGILLAYGVGYYLAFIREDYIRTGRALIFLGTVLYGAGIWLIAQIFHISAHFPNGFLLWAVGIFPIILICRSLSSLLEFSVLLAVWTASEQLGFQNSNFLYLIGVAAALAVSFRMKSEEAAGLNLAGLAVWLTAGNIAALQKSGEFFYFVTLLGLYGLTVLAAGGFLNRAFLFPAMARPFKAVGFLFTFIALYLLSFNFIMGNFRRLGTNPENFPAFTAAALAVILLLGAGTALFTLLRLKTDSGRNREPVLILILMGFLTALTLGGRSLDLQPILVVNNLLLFGAIIAVVVIGYLNRDPLALNAGLLFFVLDVIARYFDFFWDMLPRSIFFMVGGLLLLAGGVFLERNRRKIVKELQVKTHAA